MAGHFYLKNLKSIDGMECRFGVLEMTHKTRMRIEKLQFLFLFNKVSKRQLEKIKEI